MSTTPPAIKGKTLVSQEGLFQHRRFLVNGLVKLAAGATRDFISANILGVDYAKYDMDKLEVQVLVLDSEVGSPTANFYIDASAVCVLGMKDDGYVRLVNTHTDELFFWVRIIANLKEA